jgi:type I restriction enzyme R subunit
VASPEHRARAEIGRLLTAAGWSVQDVKATNLLAARGVAIRECPLEAGLGYADHLLYVDGKAAGIIEAKKQGATLTGVEVQSTRYAKGLPASLPAWQRPLPFVYESTGTETHFSNGLDPEPRARNVFAFHCPETLAGWLVPTSDGASGTFAIGPDHPSFDAASDVSAETSRAYLQARTFLHRVRQMPELITEWSDFRLWPAQITAIRNLEASLAQNKPRALILVDSGDWGRQTKKEFDQYVSPVHNYKFGEEYIGPRDAALSAV